MGSRRRADAAGHSPRTRRAGNGGSGMLGGAFVAATRLLTWPVRGVAGSSGIDVPQRLQTAAVDAAATAAVERAIDGILAGPLPERIARSLGEHRVVERVVAEAAASTDLERAVVSALESERARRLLDEVLASPALERLLAETFDSRLPSELMERVLRTPEFEQMLAQVLSSPQVRYALTHQSASLAAETAAAGRARAVRYDDAVERAPRRWLRRPPRPADTPGGSPSIAYAGLATRGAGLAVDAGLVTFGFLIVSALVGLVSSLVGHLRPVWLVEVIAGVSWVLVLGAYFVGFWTTIGQTPGMRLMGVRVRGHADAPPGVARSLVRAVGLALAIIPCFAGFLPVLVDDRRRGLQDFVAGTVVVYDEPAPATVEAAERPASGDASPRAGPVESPLTSGGSS